MQSELSSSNLEAKQAQQGQVEALTALCKEAQHQVMALQARLEANAQQQHALQQQQSEQHLQLISKQDAVQKQLEAVQTSSAQQEELAVQCKAVRQQVEALRAQASSAEQQHQQQLENFHMQLKTLQSQMVSGVQQQSAQQQEQQQQQMNETHGQLKTLHSQVASTASQQLAQQNQQTAAAKDVSGLLASGKEQHQQLLSMQAQVASLEAAVAAAAGRSSDGSGARWQEMKQQVQGLQVAALFICIHPMHSFTNLLTHSLVHSSAQYIVCSHILACSRLFNHFYAFISIYSCIHFFIHMYSVS